MQTIRRYKIADFAVRMNCRTSYMQALCAPYLDMEAERVERKRIEPQCVEPEHIEPQCVEQELDLCCEEELRKSGGAREHTLAQLEYLHTFCRFVGRLALYDAFCFHASALSVDGEGILFSADSGTGKSTHAGLWKQYMKQHEIVRLNDDKPVIRLIDGTAWVYGTPWSGKHRIHANGKAPVKALVFLEQGKENQIEKIPMEQVFPLCFPQVIGGKGSGEEIAALMGLLDLFIRQTPVYRLRCGISEEAVQLVYRTVWGKRGT